MNSKEKVEDAPSKKNSSSVLSTLALLPFILLPTLYLLSLEQKQPDANITRLASVFLFTATLGFAMIIALQSALAYAFARLVFGPTASEYLTEWSVSKDSLASMSPDRLARRRALAHSPKHALVVLFSGFVGAGAVEELVKWAITAWGVRGQPPDTDAPARAHAIFAAAVAAGLGFSTIENAGYVYAAAAAGETGWRLALSATERLVFGVAGHGLTAALLAVNLVRRDVLGEPLGVVQVLLPSVVAHGIFDSGLFGLSAWDGHVGWVHPTRARSVVVMLAFAVGVQGSTAALVWARMKEYGLR
ncbi:hypothetical protein B0H11DRAFT_1961457 [Mycena galericulata]|nr:hypothetical protein B0H11DRAFT_1961457 [Mycena galericulata]